MPSWWDRFGEEWARLGLADDPTHAQADAGFAFIGQAPPTVELFNSMFGWNDDKDNWLFGQMANVIRADGVLPDPWDLEQLLRALDNRQKILLTGPTSFFVDAINGNDATGTGEQSSPWRTIQYAIQWCLTHVEPANNSVVIQLAPGTYEPFDHHNSWNGSFIIQGDPLNPRAYLIKATNTSCVTASYGGVVFIRGVSLETDGTSGMWGSALLGTSVGVIIYDNVAFGPCTGMHIYGHVAGLVGPWFNGVNYTIYGGASCHMYGGWSGVANNYYCNVTLQNNPAFTDAFAHAGGVGGIQAYGSSYTGAAQGIRAKAIANGVITTGGVDPNVFFPGTQPAQMSTGGVII